MGGDWLGFQVVGKPSGAAVVRAGTGESRQQPQAQVSDRPTAALSEDGLLLPDDPKKRYAYLATLRDYLNNQLLAVEARLAEMAASK